MMDAIKLQNRIFKGFAAAARKCGDTVSIHRPAGIAIPISARNKIIDLPAQFLPGNSGLSVSYGQALWRGIYDASYSQAGDYLVSAQQTFFVAQQQHGLPVQCVLTNRLVSLVRPRPAAQGGYSGFFAVTGEAILTDWPASLLEMGGRGAVGKAGESYFGSWSLLLPNMTAIPQPGDVVSDNLGAVFTVSSAEHGTLGWRIMVTQIGA